MFKQKKKYINIKFIKAKAFINFKINNNLEGLIPY